jgi:hypothetical protein
MGGEMPGLSRGGSFLVRRCTSAPFDSRRWSAQALVFCGSDVERTVRVLVASTICPEAASNDCKPDKLGGVVSRGSTARDVS